jgi:formimidoylglutamate deiminase
MPPKQVREVDECIASLGSAPVQWLLDNFAVDRQWCLIHCTHMTPDETYRLAASGAVAGLCPTTEVNLGDGIFRASVYLANGGIYGVATDSNIQIDAAVELRQLEYSQRLNYRSRNVLARYEGESTGHSLYTAALTGGAQALSQPIGRLSPTGGRIPWFSTPIIPILQLARGIGSTRFCSLEAGV